jgi:hypothetical protein
MKELSLDGLHARLTVSSGRSAGGAGWRRRPGVRGSPGAVAATVTINPDEEDAPARDHGRRRRARAVFTVDESDRTRLTLATGRATADLTVTPGQSVACRWPRDAQAQPRPRAMGPARWGARPAGLAVATPNGSSRGPATSRAGHRSQSRAPHPGPSLQLSDRDATRSEGALDENVSASTFCASCRRPVQRPSNSVLSAA